MKTLKSVVSMSLKSHNSGFLLNRGSPIFSIARHSKERAVNLSWFLSHCPMIVLSVLKLGELTFYYQAIYFNEHEYQPTTKEINR